MVESQVINSFSQSEVEPSCRCWQPFVVTVNEFDFQFTDSDVSVTIEVKSDIEFTEFEMPVTDGDLGPCEFDDS